MKSFTSKSSYIEESSAYGRSVTFIVENDMDRDPALKQIAFADIVAEPVLIDGKAYRLRQVKSHLQGYGDINYGKGQLIGLDIY